MPHAQMKISVGVDDEVTWEKMCPMAWYGRYAYPRITLGTCGMIAIKAAWKSPGGWNECYNRWYRKTRKA